MSLSFSLKVLFLIIGLVFLFLAWFFIGKSPKVEKINFGVNFSQSQAENLGLDWREVYLAFLDNLKVRKLRMSVDWDLLEPRRDDFDFSDLDWQVKEAKKRGVKLILVVGMKTLRWPECHLPRWTNSLDSEQKEREVLKEIREIVLRYRDSGAIWAWQVENEAFFPFGQCPRREKGFLKKEVRLVKNLDPNHPVIITDSGEWSFWWRAAKLGDVVGVSMYRKVWIYQLKRPFNYIFPAVFYWKKKEVVEKLFDKKVIVTELQAEPWGKKPVYDLPLKEQLKLFNLDDFQENLVKAQESGFDEFYLWGGEWWYWLKEKEGISSFWEEAKNLIQDSK